MWSAGLDTGRCLDSFGIQEKLLGVIQGSMTRIVDLFLKCDGDMFLLFTLL